LKPFSGKASRHQPDNPRRNGLIRKGEDGNLGRYFDTMLQNYARADAEVFSSASTVEDVPETKDAAADVIAVDVPMAISTPTTETHLDVPESPPSARPEMRQSVQPQEPIGNREPVEVEPAVIEHIVQTEVVHDQEARFERPLPDIHAMEQPMTTSHTDLHVSELHDHPTTHEQHHHHTENITEQSTETTVYATEPAPPPQLDVPDVKDQVDAIEEQLGKALLQLRDGTFDPTSFLVPSDGFEPQQDAPHLPPEAEIITEVTHEIVREVHHHHHETRIEPATVASMPIRTAAAASQIGPIRFQSVWDRERSH
jgi:hypothetical protein